MTPGRRRARAADALLGDAEAESVGAPDPVAGEGDDLLAAPDLAVADEADTASDDAPVDGWRRVFVGNRMLWVVTIVAVGALTAGLVLGRFVISPVDAAIGQGAPEPGLITVPVEYGELSNDITMRADVGYADAVEVTLDTSSVEGAAVVTGVVPEQGADLAAESVALEVAGRPVIVLPGALPAYRTLSFGDAGPDVTQLKRALRSLDLAVGDVDSDVFDTATAEAVAALYDRVGYPAPRPPDGAEEAVVAAREGVRAAEESLVSARAALTEAGAGPSASERKAADNQVAALKRQLAAAEAARPRDSVMIGDLRDQLALAEIQRRELTAARDTTAEQAAVASAQDQISDAEEALTLARQGALTPLPASEVLYLTDLPRRVDELNVQRGAVLEGAAMVVSGATVEMSGTAAAADAELLQVDDEAFFALPDGGRHRAVISEITADAGEARATVTFTPDELTPEQIAEIQGTNVRIEVPVAATDGAVLSVPYAALTAGPGGESRVEVVEGDPREGEDAETRLVVVETGLAAGGYVEVTPVDQDLREDDLVVVGS
ncbi:hypothetical protein [Microbacterium sp.]|uniref:hypothetical protein n=1 Tax=Microbacterium sp. TaxID=51671 RepID=UPI003A8688E0